MSSVIAGTAGVQVMLPLVRSEGQCTRQPKLFGSCPIGPRPLSTQFRPFDRRRPVSHAIQAIFSPARWRPLSTQFQPFDRRRPVSHVIRAKFAPARCAATLNARCGAAQTQTVTRQQSTITIAPIQGKENSPELDDGGTGLPPHDGGGGGGGGGGGSWSGGFFLFAFLAFLGFLKDKESENEYQDDRRR